MDYLKVRKQIEQISQADKADIDWLFCYCLDINRNQLHAMPNITKKQHKTLTKYAQKLQKTPLSVALGETQFLGLKILVNRHVLSPRCETEELADYVIKDIGQRNARVLDLCCGSGAIGISIAQNTNAKVTCSDISRHALKKTRQNCKINNLNVKIVKSDMLNNIFGNFDYIVCNPPYIAKNDENIEEKVKNFEPHLALYAPNNGYYFYEYLAKHADRYLVKNSKLCLEVGINMAQNVAKLFDNYSQVKIIKDMQGIERFVIVEK